MLPRRPSLLTVAVATVAVVAVALALAVAVAVATAVATATVTVALAAVRISTAYRCLYQCNGMFVLVAGRQSQPQVGDRDPHRDVQRRHVVRDARDAHARKPPTVLNK